MITNIKTQIRKPASLKVKAFFEKLAIFIALIALLLVFVPFSPSLPNLGLDDSWRYALNEAIAHHLVFGRDVIFTFGPLASVYTQTYHPATDAIMMGYRIFFALALFVGCASLTRGKGKYLLLILPVLQQAIAIADALFVFIPFIFLLQVTGWYVEERVQDDGNGARSRWVGIAFVGTAVALLPLVKASFTGSVLACGGMALIIVARRSLLIALISLSWAATATSAVWCAVGQPLNALPGFFLAQSPIISGYAEGMSIRGPNSQILVYLIVGLVIVLTFGALLVARFGRISGPSILGLVVVLFVSFKGGFIRHDGHALIAASALLLASYLALLIFRTPQTLVLMLVGIGGWEFIASSYVGVSPRIIASRVISDIAGSMRGLRIRVLYPRAYGETFEQARADMRHQFPLPPAEGGVDLYSYDLSALFANDQKWSPRPIIQSYSAYTPELLELNRKHLTDASAPERIYFSIASIDEHYPALEDGASWPELMSRYRITSFLKEYAVLERRSASVPVDVGRVLLDANHATLGRRIPMPVSTSPIWASIDVTPTFLGRIFSALFKPPPLHLLVEYEGGASARFRFIPGMARSGFVLSPTVQNASDYAALTSTSGTNVLGGRKPLSIDILGNRSTHFFWKSEYHARFSSMIIQPDLELHSLLFHKSVAGPKHLLPPGGDCVLDEVNYSHPSLTPIKIGSSIVVQGWAAISGKDGIPNDKVFVSLTSESGTVLMAEAKKLPRADVNAYYRQPGLGNSGFEGMIDVSDLQGKFKVHIVQERREKYFECAQTSAVVIK